jgi:hypothetical protein
VANLSSNPWSIVTADAVTATPAASPGGTVLNADGTVTLTTTGAHGFTTVNAQQGLTIISETTTKYIGYYTVLAIPSGTTAILKPNFTIAKGTAGGGGGTVAICLYNSAVRVEDLSWQNASAAGQLLDFRDRNGNILWQATATGAGSQNRGKLFWVQGITPITLQSGIVIATIN